MGVALAVCGGIATGLAVIGVGSWALICWLARNDWLTSIEGDDW